MTESLQHRVTAALGHQYQIESEIGRGGMSVVYRARDLRLNRTVAVKVLPPELAHDTAVGSRFTREAQTSAQLSHAHIVPIYDVGESDGIAYFVMALITGGNLAAVLEHQPRRPIEEVRRLVSEVADALHYAHMRGVIHRDIKADNILLDAESGRAMVTDFGIARAMEGGNRLTLTGIAVGTPTYMSPEQAVGERELDGRSDIYSLGVLGYQMLTGRVPFTAGNSMALLLKHVSERPRPIAEFRPETPRAIAAVIERALQKAPEDRWHTAAAMRDALRDAPRDIAGANTSDSSWRAEQRERVRYTSPVPRAARKDVRTVAPRTSDAAPDALFEPAIALPVPVLSRTGELVDPPHLAALTALERADLRLWNGRIPLLDRVKLARGYALLTIVMAGLGVAGFVAGVSDVPPLVLSPLVPIYMAAKLRRRGKSLRDSGLRLRRVFLAPRAKWVVPAPPPPPTEKQLEKIASRAVLDGPRGAVIRRAADDRAAILDIIGSLPKADRALLPEIAPTADALVARIAHLAAMLQRLEADIEPGLVAALDERISNVGTDPDSTDEQRRVALLRRQRDTADELEKRRVILARQIDSAALALGNLRLDLIKLRSSGTQSALGDVSSATQEARVLSRDISHALDAAAELEDL